MGSDGQAVRRKRSEERGEEEREKRGREEGGQGGGGDGVGVGLGALGVWLIASAPPSLASSSSSTPPTTMLLVPPLTALVALALATPPTTALQIPLFARPPPPPPTSPPPASSSSSHSSSSSSHSLTLRHALHLSTTSRHLPASRRDYSPLDLAPLSLSASARPSGLYPATQRLSSRRIRTHRPSSQAAFHAARRASFHTPLRALHLGRLPTAQEVDDALLAGTLEWDDVEIDAPDTGDVETLAALGRMTSNAYTLPDREGWYDIGGGWNVVRPSSSRRLSLCPH